MTDNIRKFAIQHEKVFLKGLGAFSENQRTVPGREELLRRYLEVSDQRTNWGDVDKYKVLEYARKCLRVEFNG